MLRLVGAPLALLTLTSCGIDFVGPESLGLTRAPSASVTLTVTDAPAASCGLSISDPPATPERLATLCLNADFSSGRNALGEPHEFLSDTLWFNGVPVPAVSGASESLSFRASTSIPMSGLADAAIDIRYPRFAAAPQLEGLRWRFAGRSQSDTLYRDPDTPVRLELIQPAGQSIPAPGQAQWNVLLTGANATASYLGSGVPPAEFEFAPTALTQLGGNSFGATFRWIQQFIGPQNGVDVTIFTVQSMTWRIIPIDTAAVPIP